MLIILLLATIVFGVINFIFSRYDLINPTIIYLLLFFFQISLCLFATTYLDVQIHYPTVFILISSYIIFTVFNLFVNLTPTSNIYLKQSNLTLIKLDAIFKYSFLAIAILMVGLSYLQLVRVSNALGGSRDLAEMIALNDSLVKFQTEKYSNLGLGTPGYFNFFSLIMYTTGYITIYIVVNNYLLTKKVDMIQILTILFMLVNMYMGGSRSTIFRVLTFIAILFYFFSLRNGLTIKQRTSLFRKVILFGVVGLIFFILSIELYGRTNTYGTFHYLFIYFGAPLWNLDRFIQLNQLPIPTEFFGEQTFINFYRYLGEDIELKLPFVRANSEYGLGNVYTTFYQFVYDFGIIGVIPLFSIIVGYFTLSYNKLLNSVSHVTKGIDISLFIYAFLFNDLVMLFFSNRFYETVLNSRNIRLFLLVYIFDAIFYKGYFGFGRFRIVFR
ncbi:TPA: O-antigen polymerase [Streptococcus suis]